MKSKYYWLITAKRTNTENMYHVSDSTQGSRMVPNAFSLAMRYHSRKLALGRIESLKPRFAGLLDWKLIRTKEFVGAILP